MITEKNFAAALVQMGFTLCDTVYEKCFPAFSCVLQVDFEKRKLIYPDAVKGKDRNNTFDAPENFVVFECVNRLLEKGYRPEHIELEKDGIWAMMLNVVVRIFVFQHLMVQCCLL